MSVPSARKGDIDANRRSRSGEIDAIFRGSSLRKASSLDLGWQGAALERRTAEPGERSEEHIGHHFIILWDRQPALGERADLRGKFAPYAKYPGTISLGPANILPAVRARTRSDAIACTLDPALTDHLEQELDSRPTASFHERNAIEDEGLHRLLLLLLAESEGGGSYGRLYADALIQALATRFLFLARSERPPEPPRVSALPRRILQRVLDRMHADFRLDLDLETLAAVSGYSRAHFLRMFRLATGTTPHQYLQGLRLEHARRRLEDTPSALTEIALDSGFSSHSHLTTQFRQKFGMTPSRYRRNP
jgi:AraC family transcriptional regulator